MPVARFAANAHLRLESLAGRAFSADVRFQSAPTQLALCRVRPGSGLTRFDPATRAIAFLVPRSVRRAPGQAAPCARPVAGRATPPAARTRPAQQDAGGRCQCRRGKPVLACPLQVRLFPRQQRCRAAAAVAPQWRSLH